MFIAENHDIKPSEKRIWLSSPTMHPESRMYMDEAFDTNWVSTVGKNIRECETIAAKKAGVKYAVALSACTAALHLCVKLAGERLYAVDELGEDYAFVVMSDHDAYADIDSSNYYFIGHISSPLHLEVTSHAYIGVLSYVPNYGGYSSPLNSIYCAPNKIYEYAAFGIPMIGNEIPGLKYSLEYNEMGVCTNKPVREDIIRAIRIIEDDYETYKNNAYKFYKSTENKKIISEIIEE